MVIALLAVGLFCVLLFRFAIYALPAAIGMGIGYWAITTGAGAIGGVFAGLVAGVFVFMLGQHVFASSRSRATRAVVAGLFVIPAIWAGYNMVLQLSEVAGTASDLWRHVFAVVGSLTIGYVAFTKLATPPDNVPMHFTEAETSVTKSMVHSADARASRRWSRRA